jgi:hypothetical protein
MKRCLHKRTTGKNVWDRIEHVGPYLRFKVICDDCGAERISCYKWIFPKKKKIK